MKIKTKKLSYEEVLALPRPEHMKPSRPNILFRALLKAVSASELKATDFSIRRTGMEALGKDEPCLYLMNHSSFIDLKIAATVIYPRPFNIICTSDGFVGKAKFMNLIGCIPTEKFVFDVRLVRDMQYAVKNLRDSILMYPEASYSFDGTATPLPASLGKLIKLLNIPVVVIRTSGAFARDPLYNNLQLRKVSVSAEMEYLLSPEEIQSKPAAELQELLDSRFTFDNFRWQQENGVVIDEPFRADYLNRVLYKCPHCLAEGQMNGEGVTLTCSACGRSYELLENGSLRAVDGETIFDHVPDWYRWERKCVRDEITEGKYQLDVPVDIRMMVDMNCIYEVGDGRLVHDASGFHLTGCDGKLDVRQPSGASYSLYSDYFWYELGDMICIGGNGTLYYCFPKGGVDVAAKTRLAAEEMFKLR